VSKDQKITTERIKGGHHHFVKEERKKKKITKHGYLFACDVCKWDFEWNGLCFSISRTVFNDMNSLKKPTLLWLQL
jgi:hypothetical protein